MTKEELDQLTYRASRMEINNVDDPYLAVEDFFSCFPLAECREHLWELYEGWVNYHKEESPGIDDPAIILFYYTHLEMLIEAAWLLNNKWKCRKNNKNK